MTDLVGVPDPAVLAADMASNGHRSCADAEAKGWTVTTHEETRRRVDALLAYLADVGGFR